MTPTSKPAAIVIDANVLIAICASEKDNYQTAKDALENTATNGFAFAVEALLHSYWG